MKFTELLADERFVKCCEERGDISRELEDLQSPWALVNSYAVGGLASVGFAEDSDLLLVTSSDGRGLFDCISGEKIARDYDLIPSYEEQLRLIAPGVGPLDGKIIRMAGLHGGGLPTMTKDGWSLEIVHLDWNTSFVILHGRYFVFATDEAVRAFGFSYTGNSFVIAEGSH